MKSILPLNEMTRIQKLQAMEELWKDLSSPQEDFECPDWHKAVLEDRAQSVAEGKAEYMSWDEAKKRLRKRNQ